jgi:mannitol-1-phosphate/altronate dehydrogenase
MAETAGHRDIMAIARAAFLDESGAALVKKYRLTGDPLFTSDGYRAYAEDLIQRMVNPYLNDLITRVTRDARRKLAYDDRLFGTMRLAFGQGIEPRHMAHGAAAAVLSINDNPPLSQEDLRSMLYEIWGRPVDEHADHVIALTWQTMQQLRTWSTMTS